MPKINYNSKGGQIIFDADDWLAGINPKGFDTVLGGGNTTSNYINPYYILGVATPGPLPQNVTGISAVSACLSNAIVYNDKAYAIEAGTALQEITNLTTGEMTIGGATFPHVIDHGHAGETGDDIVAYTALRTSASCLRAFYSFRDASDWDVGAFTLSALSATGFDDNFMSTEPSTPLASPYLAGGATAPHPLIVGDDDILYMGDRNFVHGYDGSSGTNGAFNAAVLTLPNDYIITAFAKLAPTTLVVFAYRNNTGSGFYKSEAKAFFWDYLSLDPYKIIDLNDYYVGSAFTWKDTVGCFTKGQRNVLASSNQTKLKIFNGSQFQTVASFSENPPINGGIQVDENQIIWNSGGIMYSYGKVFEGLEPRLHKLSKGTGSTNGMCKSLTSSLLLMSTGAAGSGGLQRFLNSSFLDTSYLETGNVYPQFPFGMCGKVTKMRVEFWGEAENGRTITIGLRTNYDNSSSGSIIFGLKNITSSTVEIKADNLIKERYKTTTTFLAPFYCVFLTLTWETGSGATNAPKVKRVIVEYENIPINKY